MLIGELPLDGGRNDHGQADDDRANHDAKRRVLVLLDLLSEGEREDKFDDEEADSKENQPKEREHHAGDDLLDEIARHRFAFLPESQGVARLVSS